MKLVIRTHEGGRVGEVYEDLTYDLSVPDTDRQRVVGCIQRGEARQKPDIGSADPEPYSTPPEEFTTYRGGEALQRVKHALKGATPYRGELVGDDE